MLHTYTFEEPFVTESGYRLAAPRAAYRTWGRLNRARDNVVLVFHALTGNCHADDWFDGFFGPRRLLDPLNRFILCVNVPGSCYGSTGPASVNPRTGRRYRADFPEITIRDMVRFHQRLLDALQIRGVELAIGGSMGGMQALEFCAMDRRARSAILIGMGKSHSPWSIALNHVQRQAIRNDPHWEGGYYPEDRPPVRGLALARQIAMNSYRSPENFASKFGREKRRDDGRFQVESYLDYQGEKLARRFDAVSYMRLSRAMDSHDVGRGRGGAAEALSRIDIPVLVAGIDSDRLYPTPEQRELAGLLARGRYAEIRSPHGHDAFLIEFEQMNEAFKPFLENLELQLYT